ncbi:protein FAM210A [Spea bombifrons]|uniref:protein FAM210A n=1 Tax=Spea bombifrons TaxID=233779 RepID=UPI00234B5549|nr:protein FAM210A [Spea bombifrons]XP_053323990.1 protein FAM210A [Spea bombifrons]
MHALRTLLLRSNAKSALRLPTSSLQLCTQQPPVSLKFGCQVLVAHGQHRHWLHSPPGQNVSQDKTSQTPSVEGENPYKSEGNQPATASDSDPFQDKSIGLFHRFKKTFKQHGKVLIPVHLVTSSIWFGSFYYAAMKGVNVVPFLELIGLPDVIVNILKNSQGGNALTAYALYKIATPARYTVTLGGTSLSVKYLRKYGYLSTPPLVKDYLHNRMEVTKERLSEKMEETRDIISGKMEETKDKITEKLQETKDKVSFRKKKDE